MIEKDKLSVAKITFGAEPKDYEIQESINRHYSAKNYKHCACSNTIFQQRQHGQHLELEYGGSCASASKLQR